MMNVHLKFFILLFFFITISVSSIVWSQKQFTIVIDPGHGGHDAGAVGTYSKEKNINLAVALKLGQLINQKYPSVKVIYTRKKDVFITLQGRADVANNNHADIFISIHTNSASSASPHGSETFVLGLSRSKSNLEVAKRENSVITLEDDYKTKYQGFDPNSIDSYVMFQYMQNQYLDKSLQLAMLIEDQFKLKTARYSRGVKQNIFWVLHKSACPSVLVELGFISNPKDEKYLNSDSGRNQLAEALFVAFEKYKREYDRKSGINVPDSEKQLSESNNHIDSKHIDEYDTSILDPGNQIAATSDIVTYRIQLFALTRQLKSGSAEFKGLKNVTNYREGNFYKYTYGETNSYTSIYELRKSIIKKFPDSYIIAFKGEKKLPLSEARKLTNE